MGWNLNGMDRDPEWDPEVSRSGFGRYSAWPIPKLGFRIPNFRISFPKTTVEKFIFFYQIENLNFFEFLVLLGYDWLNCRLNPKILLGIFQLSGYSGFDIGIDFCKYRIFGDNIEANPDPENWLIILFETKKQPLHNPFNLGVWRDRIC